MAFIDEMQAELDRRIEEAKNISKNCEKTGWGLDE